MRVEFTERAQIVENPERPPLGGRDQISLMHLEVRDGRNGKIILQGLPVVSFVEGDVGAEFGAGILVIITPNYLI